MKKPYSAPILISSGDVVASTQLGFMPVTEDADPPITKNHSAGSVGYYL